MDHIRSLVDWSVEEVHVKDCGEATVEFSNVEEFVDVERWCVRAGAACAAAHDVLVFGLMILANVKDQVCDRARLRGQRLRQTTRHG